MKLRHVSSLGPIRLFNELVSFCCSSVRGIHLNFLQSYAISMRLLVKRILFSVLPSRFGDGFMPTCMGGNLRERLSFMLQESGYFHIQATKPDTVGESL